MLLDVYASLLILFFFIVSVAKGLLTPAWKLREGNKDRSRAGTVFWLTLTIALLFALKHFYFGQRSDSALSVGLSAILVYESARAFGKLVFGWDFSRLPQTVQKLPALAELGYFGLLVMGLFRGPVGREARHEKYAALITSDGQHLDASLYQTDPRIFLERARLRLTTQMEQMSKMKERFEIQKDYYQRSGKPNVPDVVAAIDRFEGKIEQVWAASAKVQEDFADRNTLSAAESASFLRALEWNDNMLQTGERTITVLKEQTGG